MRQSPGAPGANAVLAHLARPAAARALSSDPRDGGIFLFGFPDPHFGPAGFLCPLYPISYSSAQGTSGDLSLAGNQPIMAIQIAMSSGSSMKQQEYSVAEARDRLAELVHEAEQGRPIRITRRGKPAAVLVSEEEFQRAHGRRNQGPGDAILAWRKKYGGVQLTDAEIDRWRDRSIGRVPDFSGKK